MSTSKEYLDKNDTNIYESLNKKGVMDNIKVTNIFY